MTTVLAIGDVHIKVNNIPESKEVIKRLTDLAKERKPDIIVCLGDVLDRHSTIHVQCLMEAEEMTQKLSEIAPFFLIVGNHDRPNNSNFLTDEHPFNAMKKWNNVVIVDKVVDYKIKNHRFIMVPYVAPGRFSEALETIENPYKDVTCYFGHQEIFNCKMGAIISKCGDKWPAENKLLVSGHIHDYQQLQDNMIYTGSCIQHSFGDSCWKTVSMFTFGNDSCNENKDSEWSPEWKEERIDLGMKKKVTVYITPREVNSYKVSEDKIVKLVIRGEESEIKAVAKLDKIQQLKKEGVKVAFKVIQSVETNNNVVTKMSYKDRLFKELQGDLHCISWYNKLFS